MTWGVWIAFGAFVVASVWLLSRTMKLYNGVFKDEPMVGTRTRRLLSRRMIFAVGVWQCTVGVVIIAGPGPWASSTSVIGVGLMMMTMAWLWKKVGLPA